MQAHISDDDLLVDLRAQLDTILGVKNEALPMEVYTFVIMRALRVLKEDF